MGVEGAALGTLISRIIMFLLIAYVVKINKRFEIYHRNLFQVRLYRGIFKRLFPSDSPLHCKCFLRLLFSLLQSGCQGYLEKMLKLQTKFAFNLSSMTYMVAIGVGVTSMIRVGNEKVKEIFLI